MLRSPEPWLRCVLALAMIVGAGRAAAQQAPPAAVPAEVPIPRSIPGRKFAALLKAFNSGDPGAMRKFIASNYASSALAQRSAEQRAATYAELYKGSGGFLVRKIEKSEEYELVALAQGKSIADWVRITLTVENDVPYGIPGITFEYVVPPAMAGPRLSDEEIAAEMGRYLARLTEADLFSGAVIIARDGRPIFQKAYGTLRRSPGTPVTLDTQFGLASLGKMFTAVAIAQLAQAGKLSYDDPVSKFLPDTPRALTDKITIHQLLTHTAGLGPFMDAKFFEAHRNAHSYQEYLPDIFREPLVTAPGAKFSYGNGDYLVLSAVVEKLAGTSYADFLAEHIHKPAGMADSRVGATTAGDLVRFAQALRENRLLSPENTQRLLTGKVATGEDGQRYAYGFNELRINGQRICGHGGGGPYVSDLFDMYMDSGYTVVVLSDREPDVAGRAGTMARTMLTQK